MLISGTQFLSTHSSTNSTLLRFLPIKLLTTFRAFAIQFIVTKCSSPRYSYNLILDITFLFTKAFPDPLIWISCISSHHFLFSYAACLSWITCFITWYYLSIYLLIYVPPQWHKVHKNEQVINLVPDGINSAQYAAWLGVGTPNMCWIDERVCIFIHICKCKTAVK